MRIAVAEVAQETDSFSPLVATDDDFAAYGWYQGVEILERMQGVGPIGGFLEVAAEQAPPPEIVPLVRCWGGAGGTIAAATLERMIGQLRAALQSAGRLDALFLSLHGAAASQHVDDVEGHVLAVVRQIVGAELPVVVSLDHHANITRQMVQHATLLVGHETQPHHPVATGRKAARLLFRILRNEVQPTMAWRKLPLVTPQDQFLTSSGPMQRWFDRARQLEQCAGVLDVSPYPMQPWLDVAEGGWAVVVHTDNNPALAEELATEMAQLAWSMKDEFFRSERVPPRDAVRQAVALAASWKSPDGNALANASGGLTILSDTGDSVYGGAPGDNTTLLAALLAERVPVPALVPVVDPQAVAAALQAGVGARLTLELGGHVDQAFCRTVPVEVDVAAVSHGFVVDLADRGVCNLRRTALVRAGQVQIALLEHRSFAINHPVLYLHLGVEMADARMVVVKTASNFQFFQRWRRHLIRVDTPGTTQSNLLDFHWQRVPRPWYPLDPQVAYDGRQASSG